MRRLSILAGLLLLAGGLPLAAAEGGGWLWEAGVLAGQHDNFFFRGGGGAQPSSDLFSGYLSGEHEREAGRGELTILVGGQGVFVSDIPNADYQSFDLGAEYKAGPLKVHGGVALTLNRLFSEEGEAAFFDEQSVDLWVRYSLNRRVWLRGGVELEQWDFDPAENDRDADVLKLDLTARVALSERAALRLALLYEDRDANGPRNNRSGAGWAVALEAQPRDGVDLFLRYRSRDRQYEDAPPGDRNFGRDDTTTDVNLNLRWRLSERFGVQLRDTFRDGESTRPDRNFDGNQVEVGVFVLF